MVIDLQTIFNFLEVSCFIFQFDFDNCWITGGRNITFCVDVVYKYSYKQMMV